MNSNPKLDTFLILELYLKMDWANPLVLSNYSFKILINLSSDFKSMTTSGFLVLFSILKIYP